MPVYREAVAIAGAATQCDLDARVGPNAVVQLAAALSELEGEAVCRRLFLRLGHGMLLEEPPREMIPEAVPARLFKIVCRELAPARATAVLHRAGTRTLAYILAHRIPAPAQALIRALPSPITARVRLNAIARHAWTFAGSGIVTCSYGSALALTIIGNPLATAGCPWHTGVLEHLFRALAGAHRRVRQDACCMQGHRHCCFVIK